MYLLDTDHIGILQGKKRLEAERLLTRMSAHSATDFFTSIVSFHEQVLGWNAYLAKARDTTGVVRAYSMFERILTDFSIAHVAPFDDRAAEVFVLLRAQKIRVSTMDLRIASIALSNRWTLLSRNLADFRQVPGLIIEDWTA